MLFRTSNKTESQYLIDIVTKIDTVQFIRRIKYTIFINSRVVTDHLSNCKQFKNYSPLSWPLYQHNILPLLLNGLLTFMLEHLNQLYFYYIISCF